MGQEIAHDGDSAPDQGQKQGDVERPEPIVTLVIHRGQGRLDKATLFWPGLKNRSVHNLARAYGGPEAGFFTAVFWNP